MRGLAGPRPGRGLPSNFPCGQGHTGQYVMFVLKITRYIFFTHIGPGRTEICGTEVKSSESKT